MEMVGGFWKQGPMVGILAFEVAYVMSKLVHLWVALSPNQIDRVRKFICDSVGLKELVSHDADFIRGLIPGELFENMIPLTEYVVRLGKNHCSDPCLKDFEHAVCDWIDNGADPFGWKLPWEEMAKEANEMASLISITVNLYDRMKHLLDLERTRNTMDGPIWLEIQNKIELKQLEVEKLKEESFWNMTFDYVCILFARSIFTIFSRIKSVYGVPQLNTEHISTPSPSIFSKYKLLEAPPDTLGAAALELQYANIVILIEKFVRSPVPLYFKWTDELYDMLPANMRAELSKRLPPVQSLTRSSIKDELAERNVAMAELLKWLAPLAQNTNKWHSVWKHHQKAYPTWSHVLLVETLYFASKQKTEAAITELIVGLQCRKRGAELRVYGGYKSKASIVLEQ